VPLLRFLELSKPSVSSVSRHSASNVAVSFCVIREFSADAYVPQPRVESNAACGGTPKFTGRTPRSGVSRYLSLLTGRKSAFSPRRGDSLRRFTSNLAQPRGTWVRLAIQNFMPIGAKVGTRPKNGKNFHFLVKNHPAGRNL